MPLPRPEHYCRVFLSAAAVNLKRSPRQIPSAGTPVDTQDFTEHNKIGWRRHYKLVGEDIQAKAPVVRNVRDAKAAPPKFKSEIRHHGRQSWIPINLAGGGS